jgi:hypothetical protein
VRSSISAAGTDRNVGACRRKSQRKGAADAATAAGGDDAFLLEVESHVQFTRHHDALDRRAASPLATPHLPATLAALAR